MLTETTHTTLTMNPGALFDAGLALGMGIGYGVLAVILMLCLAALLVDAATVAARAGVAAARSAWRWAASKRAAAP